MTESLEQARIRWLSKLFSFVEAQNNTIN